MNDKIKNNIYKIGDILEELKNISDSLVEYSIENNCDLILSAINNIENARIDINDHYQKLLDELGREKFKKIKNF
jgi:hypothetical protein